MEDNTKHAITNITAYIKSEVETLREPYFEVILKGDCNDGDYVETIQTYDVEEFEYILPCLAYLKAYCFKHHGVDENGINRFKFGENVYEPAWELDIPSSEWGYCHTLETMGVRYYDEKGIVHQVDISYGNVQDTQVDQKENMILLALKEKEPLVEVVEEDE